MKKHVHLLIFTLAMLAAVPLPAKTVTVTSAVDYGAGTLREAVSSAAAGDTIVFANGIETIQLDDKIEIDKKVTINGHKDKNIVIKGLTLGYGRKQHFYVLSDGKLCLNHLTLRDSWNGCSGGSIVNSGRLVINSCTFSNNRSGTSSSGGAIYSDGEAYITSCSFEDNRSDVGGALYNKSGEMHVIGCGFKNNRGTIGGAVYNYSSLHIIGSIFEENVGNNAGAVFNRSTASIDGCVFSRNSAAFYSAISNNGTLDVANSTFKRNVASDGSTFDDRRVATILNCLFAENTAKYDEGTISTTFTGNSAPLVECSIYFSFCHTFISFYFVENQ